jgi:hypothetical protein
MEVGPELDVIFVLEWTNAICFLLTQSISRSHTRIQPVIIVFMRSRGADSSIPAVHNAPPIHKTGKEVMTALFGALNKRHKSNKKGMKTV